MFAQADEFAAHVRRLEAVRRRLSPRTRTFLKELGVILHDANHIDAAPIPSVFWAASAAYWAYLYGLLAAQDIDAVSMSQLVAGPPKGCALPDGTPCSGGGSSSGSACQCHGPNFASVSMLDWEHGGRPTARWYVLKMLVDAFGNRSKRLVATSVSNIAVHEGEPGAAPPRISPVFAQAIEVTEKGGAKARKLLLVNKGLKTQTLRLSTSTNAAVAAAAGFRCIVSIGGDDSWAAPATAPIPSGTTMITLRPFGVAIMTADSC